MVTALNLMERLDSREKVHPSELDLYVLLAETVRSSDCVDCPSHRGIAIVFRFYRALETRARMHRAGAPYSPVYPTVGRLFPGTYFLNGIDSSWRRSYTRVPLDAEMSQTGAQLAPPIVIRMAKQDAMSQPVTGKLQVLSSTQDGSGDKITESRRRIACVITGTAAGLPGSKEVFSSSNMQRLVDGESCISQVSGSMKSAMLEKSVVQVKKSPDGSSKRHKVDTEADVIKLAAQLGSFDLSVSYGVPKGLAETMDVAAQVAVAAGMEALKSAGLVSGKSNDQKEWKLPGMKWLH